MNHEKDPFSLKQGDCPALRPAMTFSDAHHATTNCCGARSLGQESQGPTDKRTLLPCSLGHMGNAQSGSGVLCVPHRKISHLYCYQGKKLLFAYKRIHS